MSKSETSLDIRVHPLVVMSIADHFTRNKMQSSFSSTQKGTLGCLLGMQEGLVISLLETFEVGYTADGVAKEALESDLKLFSEAYSNYELLGWYTTGDKLGAEHVTVNTTFSEINERPIVLLLDPDDSSDGLPLRAFQAAVATGGDAFVELPFNVVSDEAERVTMVHCADVVQERSSASESVASTALANYKKALGMLSKNIQVLQSYMLAVQDGKEKPDHELMRDIKALCARLPLMNADVNFNSDFNSEASDAALVTLLSAVTQGNALVSEVVGKHNSSSNKGGNTLGAYGLDMGEVWG